MSARPYTGPVVVITDGELTAVAHALGLIPVPATRDLRDRIKQAIALKEGEK